MVLTALLTVIVFFTTDKITTDAELYSLGTMDHHRYVAMAVGNTFDFHLAPFSWRVLVPLLVKLQPFGVQTGFLLITVVSLWLSGFMLYYVLKAAGLQRVYGVFGVLLFFSMGWLTKQYIFDFWLPDLPVILFILIVVYAIYTKRDMLFVGALILGALTKETIMFAVPLYYTLNAAKLIDWPLLRRTVLLAMPAVIILTLLRIFIPAMNGDPAYLATLPAVMTLAPDYELVPYSVTHMLQAFGGERLQELTPYNVGLRYLLFPLGIAPVALPFLAPKQIGMTALRWSPYLLLVYAQLLLAFNTERLVSLAFPPLILLSSMAVRSLMGSLRLNPLWSPVLPLSLFLLGAASTDPEWSYLSLSWQVIICLIFLLVICVVFLNNRKRASADSPAPGSAA